MKSKAVAILLVVAALVAAVVTLLLRPPSALVSGRVNAWLAGEVRKATGRDLVIKGQTSVSLFPRARLKLSDVTLSGAAGESGEPLFKAAVIEASADLLPLVRGSRSLDSVRVEAASLALAVDGKGKGNWQFDVPGSSALGVGTLELTRATLAFTDARNGTSAKAADVEGTLKDVTGDRVGAFSLKNGALAWSGGGASTSVSAAIDRGAIAGEKLSASGVERLGLDAGQLSLRTGDESQALTLDGAKLTLARVTADQIGALAVKSAALRYAQSSGAIVAARGIDASASDLTAAKTGALTLAVDRIGLARGEEKPSFEIGKLETASPGGAFAGPLATDFAFDWNKERVSGNLKLATPATLNEAKPIPMTLSVAARGASATIDGSLTSLSVIDGKAVLDAKSLRDLAAWLGTELPKPGPLAAARLEGRLSASAKRIAFMDAEMSLDATKAKGSLAVDLAGPRPKLSGTIAADLFDADAYGLGTPPPKKRDVGPAAAAIEEAAEPPPVSLKDALKVYLRKQLKVLEAPEAAAAAVSAEPTLEELEAGGSDRSLAAGTAKKPKPQPWSDTPIDLAGLKRVDVDMAVSVAKLKWAGVEMGVPDAKAKLDDGALVLETRSLEVKGGKLSGRAQVDATAAKPRIATSIKAENVEALDIFDALGVTDYVAGKSAIEADLSGSAGSQKELVESVSGTVKVRMSKGAIVGYDFGDVVGAFFEWLSGDLKYDSRRRSRFDKLEAEMKLTNGLAKSNGMRVDGPVISLTSDGTAKLPAREIDYRARVNLAAWFQPIAVRIFGDWTKPSKAVDVFDFSRNPGAVASPMEVFRRLDIKDPELAALVAQVLERSETRPLPPHVKDFLVSLKARAEGKD
jgi:uncharacterized protein involved in outer membrane biogenesis